jgi:hypothetical protein
VDYNALPATRYPLPAFPQHDDSGNPGALVAIVATAPSWRWEQHTE